MSDKFEKKGIGELLVDLPRKEAREVFSEKGVFVLLDTNFLFVMFQFHIDVISVIRELVGQSAKFGILEGTVHELSAIERKKTKNKKFLQLISTLLHRYSFCVLSSEEHYVDKDILNILQEKKRDNLVIATNDKALRQLIKKEGTRNVYLRQKQYLALE